MKRAIATLIGILISGTALASLNAGMVLWASGSAGSNLSASANRYLPIAGVVAPNATRTSVDLANPPLCPWVFSCALGAAPTSGNSYTASVNRDGTNTNCACTIADAATSCEDTSCSRIATSSSLSIEFDPTGTPTETSARCYLYARLC